MGIIHLQKMAINLLFGGFNPSQKYESNWESSSIFKVKIKNLWVATTKFIVFGDLEWLWDHHGSTPMAFPVDIVPHPHGCRNLSGFKWPTMVSFVPWVSWEHVLVVKKTRISVYIYYIYKTYIYIDTCKERERERGRKILDIREV